MKERLQIVMKNEKKEMERLVFEKKQLEWQLKYAPLMSTNVTTERLEEVNKELKERKDLYNRLYWIYEG